MEANKMEPNKENVRRSKIPLPVRLTNTGRVSQHDQNIKPIRNPLRTITGQINFCTSSAGTSKNTLDRHVTRRNLTEDLDWQFKVFRDMERQSTPIPFQASPPLAVSTAKKVKSSLRRSYSRGLQRPIPYALAHKEVECFSTEGEKSKDFLKGVSMDVHSQNYTGDTMQYLISQERKVAGGPTIRRAARSCVVNWLVKLDNHRGNPAVLQSACWYLDRYLSIVFVPVDRLQLTAAACYWLATKFHGNPISVQRLIKCTSDAFSTSKLVTTEMNVFKKLQYSVQQVIPNDFIPFLSWWCDPDMSHLVESAANFICLCGVLVSKNLCEEYPSVVATACVHNALILLERRELLEKFESCPIYKKASKKAKNLSTISAHLRYCLRVMASISYEYKAPIYQHSVSPHYIAPRIIKAVNSEEIMILDKK